MLSLQLEAPSQRLVRWDLECHPPGLSHTRPVCAEGITSVATLLTFDSYFLLWWPFCKGRHPAFTSGLYVHMREHAHGCTQHAWVCTLTNLWAPGKRNKCLVSQNMTTRKTFVPFQWTSLVGFHLHLSNKARIFSSHGSSFPQQLSVYPSTTITKRDGLTSCWMKSQEARMEKILFRATGKDNAGVTSFLSRHITWGAYTESCGKACWGAHSWACPVWSGSSRRKEGRQGFLDRFSSKSRRRVWACSVCVIKIEDRNTSGHVFVFLEKF